MHVQLLVMLEHSRLRLPQRSKNTVCHRHEHHRYLVRIECFMSFVKQLSKSHTTVTITYALITKPVLFYLQIWLAILHRLHHKEVRLVLCLITKVQWVSTQITWDHQYMAAKLCLTVATSPSFFYNFWRWCLAHCYWTKVNFIYWNWEHSETKRGWGDGGTLKVNNRIVHI